MLEKAQKHYKARRYKLRSTPLSMRKLTRGVATTRKA